MNDCPTCGYPMVWSDDHRRPICCVWGDHLAPLATTPARFIQPSDTDTERRLRAVS